MFEDSQCAILWCHALFTICKVWNLSRAKAQLKLLHLLAKLLATQHANTKNFCQSIATISTMRTAPFFEKFGFHAGLMQRNTVYSEYFSVFSQSAGCWLDSSRSCTFWVVLGRVSVIKLCQIQLVMWQRGQPEAFTVFTRRSLNTCFPRVFSHREHFYTSSKSLFHSYYMLPVYPTSQLFELHIDATQHNRKMPPTDHLRNPIIIL